MLYKIYHPKIDSNNVNAFLYTNRIGVYLTNTQYMLYSLKKAIQAKITTATTRRRTKNIHFHKQK